MSLSVIKEDQESTGETNAAPEDSVQDTNLANGVPNEDLNCGKRETSCPMDSVSDGEGRGSIGCGEENDEGTALDIDTEHRDSALDEELDKNTEVITLDGQV